MLDQIIKVEFFKMIKKLFYCNAQSKHKSAKHYLNVPKSVFLMMSLHFQNNCVAQKIFSQRLTRRIPFFCFKLKAGNHLYRSVVEVYRKCLFRNGILGHFLLIMLIFIYRIRSWNIISWILKQTILMYLLFIRDTNIIQLNL